MKVTILIDNPKQDKDLVEPLMQKFRELIQNCGVSPCIIEFDGVNIIITPDRKGAKNKEHKKKKVA